jgi:hypothetical protein
MYDNSLFPGWIEPLLERIHRNASTVVCPVIDVIDDNTFEYHYSKAYFTNVGGIHLHTSYSSSNNWQASTGLCNSTGTQSQKEIVKTGGISTRSHRPQWFIWFGNLITDHLKGRWPFLD